MPFHQANLALQEEVHQDFQCMRDKVVHSLNVIAQDVADQPSEEPLQEEASANTATTGNCQGSNTNCEDQLMNMVQALTSQLSVMTARVNNIAQNQTQHRGGGNPNDTHNQTCSNIRFYCWSHGACNHLGANCHNPKPGHKNDATFKNRMGGSNYFCCQTMENNE